MVLRSQALIFVLLALASCRSGWTDAQELHRSSGGAVEFLPEPYRAGSIFFGIDYEHLFFALRVEAAESRTEYWRSNFFSVPDDWRERTEAARAELTEAQVSERRDGFEAAFLPSPLATGRSDDWFVGYHAGVDAIQRGLLRYEGYSPHGTANGFEDGPPLFDPR